MIRWNVVPLVSVASMVFGSPVETAAAVPDGWNAFATNVSSMDGYVREKIRVEHNALASHFLLTANSPVEKQLLDLLMEDCREHCDLYGDLNEMTDSERYRLARDLDLDDDSIRGPAYHILAMCAADSTPSDQRLRLVQDGLNGVSKNEALAHRAAWLASHGYRMATELRRTGLAISLEAEVERLCLVAARRATMPLQRRWRYEDFRWIISNGIRYETGLRIADAIADLGPDWAWLASMTRAEAEKAEAWRYRGAGYAKTVSPEGWQGFRKHIRLAADAARSAAKIQSELPEAATLLIIINKVGEGGLFENERAWFERARELQPSFAPAYDRYLDAIRPQWGGSKEAMLRFAVEWIDTELWESDLPYRAWNVMVEANELDGDHREVWKRSDIYSAMKRGFEGTLARGLPHRRLERNRARLAGIATIAGDYETAKEHLDSVATEDGRDGLVRLRMLPEDIFSEVVPESRLPPGTADRVRAAVRLGNWVTARDATERILRNVEMDAETRHWMRHRHTVYSSLADLNAHGVTKASVGIGLPGWSEVSGTWTGEGGQLTVGTDSDEGHHEIAWVPRVDDLHRLRFRLHRPLKRTGGVLEVRFGIDDSQGSVKFLTFCYDLDASEAWVMDRTYAASSTPKQHIPLENGSFQFEIAYHDDSCMFAINDVIVHEGRPPVRRKAKPGDGFRFVVANPTTRLTFSEIEVGAR